MGRPADDPDERTPLSQSSIRKPSRKRLFIKKLLFVALVIVVVLAVISTLLNLGQSTSKKNPKVPGEDIPPGEKPPSLDLPGDGDGPYCTSATIHTGQIFHDISLNENLGIQQTTYDYSDTDYERGGYPVRTSGELRLRRLPKDSKYRSSGLIQMDIHVSDRELKVLKTWDDSTNVMTISTPRMGQSSDKPKYDDCISLEVTVWLPEDATLSALSMLSTTLDLRVFDDIKMKVSGNTEFGSVSGNINFPEIGQEGKAPPNNYPLDSRHITVETVSGNIKGIYPLYDYLKLGSQSGDITVGVYPQPVLPSEPASADLEVSTGSGIIKVTLPAEIPHYSPPPRDYVTRVSSVAGDVSGTYFLGSVGSFKSTSGDLHAKVLPVIQYSPSTDPDDAPKSQFDSLTASGEHDFDLLDPVFISLLPSNKNDQHDNTPEPYIPIRDNDPYHLLPPDLNEDDVLDERHVAATKKWRTLKSSHQSSSANIKVRYPLAWEGTVTGKVVSGGIDVDGEDLKIIKYSKGWAYKELIAGKGVSKQGEGSTSAMNTMAGNLSFRIG